MVHLYNSTPVCWGSMKQTITALSTCEAEYIAATAAAQQTTWIRRILQDVNILPPSPTPFRIDIQSAIRVAKNSGPTKRRKFIDLRHHYLAHQTTVKAIDIKHISTKEMLADILTKPLTPAPFTTVTRQLQVCEPTPLPTGRPQTIHRATATAEV